MQELTALAVAPSALPPPPLLLQVYKLYGGPHGFMISTGVAEPDADHAATLLRFSLHVLQAAQSVRPARRHAPSPACPPVPAPLLSCPLLQLLHLHHLHGAARHVPHLEQHHPPDHPACLPAFPARLCAPPCRSGCRARCLST